ncbi:hypothetical protein ACCO45_007676 [Purpureocillium lilacinum]|uniref:Uncharacterized protein n=1 Tax=Purpureocillium lilacinum TaxID=33203 RepID=A0ACC4DP66_PURLI
MQRLPALRLMPLGGSITYGQGSSHGNGYRQALRELLVADGHRVQMVGSRTAGTMTDNCNEGWRGFTVKQIEAKARRSVPRALPNLFTVNAGSNDCIQALDLRSASQRVTDLLEFLWGHRQILPSYCLLCSSANKRLVLVDMHGPDGPQRDDLVDGTHPNDDGYVKMAKIWHHGVGVAMAKGLLQPPQAPC